MGAERADVREFATYGNTKWQAQHLVALAVLAARSDGRRMTDVFTQATRLSQTMYGLVAVQTFQGLMRALVTSGKQLLPLVWRRLQTIMQQVGGEHECLGRWLPLARGSPRPALAATSRGSQRGIMATGAEPIRVASGRTKSGVVKS